MAVKISMPKLSDTMTEGKLIAWRKKEGDEVKPGDVLAEVETDKANMDLESFDKGTLLKCLVKENEKVRVGAVLAVIGDRKENIDAILKEISGAAQVPVETEKRRDGETEKARSPEPEKVPLTRPPEADALSPGAIRVSPLAARMAAEHGIPLEGVRGSGPGGRIVKADIETVLSQGLHLQPKRPAAAAIQIVNKLVETLTPLDGMRKVIADRMTQAKQTIPHFYLQDRIPMDRVVGLRAALNSRTPDR
ncbi:E3 binding domain-containing protein, partial [bacterium]|nr:E3 binding domain-containing protein [bacterium]